MDSATPRTLVLELGMGVNVHGQDCTTAKAVSGGLVVPDSDALIACAAITVSARYPEA